MDNNELGGDEITTPQTNSEYTLEQAIAILFYFMIAADGVIDPDEIKYIQENDFCIKHNMVDHVDIFSEFAAQDDAVERLQPQLMSVFSDCDLAFRTEFINNLTPLIFADGDVSDSETRLMGICSVVIGGSVDELNQIMKERNAELQEKNAALRAQIDDVKSETKSASEGCFVATATMGSYDNSVVLDLRRFRDDYLLNSLSGRIFVTTYYKIGPYFANIIIKSSYLRKISKQILIMPLHKIIAKKYLKK